MINIVLVKFAGKPESLRVKTAVKLECVETETGIEMDNMTNLNNDNTLEICASNNEATRSTIFNILSSQLMGYSIREHLLKNSREGFDTLCASYSNGHKTFTVMNKCTDINYVETARREIINEINGGINK